MGFGRMAFLLNGVKVWATESVEKLLFSTFYGFLVVRERSPRQLMAQPQQFHIVL